MSRFGEGDDSFDTRMGDIKSHLAIVRNLLWGTLTWLVLLNAVFAGLTFLMFYLGGFFNVLGWVLIIIWAILDWRGLRQVFRLLRGDLSL